MGATAGTGAPDTLLRRGVRAAARGLDRVFEPADGPVERYAAYGGLAVGLALTPFVVDGGPRFWLLLGLLVACAITWCAGFGSVLPSPTGPLDPPGPPAVGIVFTVGLLALMAALTYASPMFGFLAFAAYTNSFTHLPGRWRHVGVGAGAVLVSYCQLGGRLGDDLGPAFWVGLAVLSVANFLLAGVMLHYATLLIDRTARQRAMIEALDEANRRLSETMAENARLQAQLLTRAHETGVLDERARLAGEIHDTLAQGLTGIITQLEAADAADRDDTMTSQGRRRHVDAARALARESLAEARRSVDALSPGRLEQTRLPDAVAGMAMAWAQRSGVELVCDTTGSAQPLSHEVEVTLFRVAQEALANVAKHAAATRVGLTLSYMDDVVVLDVRDDGCGFDPAAMPPRSTGTGFGLAGMEQRVRRVAGRWAVESAPGEGTALSASLPAIP